ncbi:MAG: hypothetical protein IH859_07575 [Chloroflexi bacterium]|nr:hypothetical protein [Chloroflexota bacterium]
MCQTLVNFQNEADGKTEFDALREMVAQKALELAFRRHLVQMEVPHQLVESKKFTEQDYHDIALGGRRCEVIGGLVSRREDINRIRETPDTVLNELALAPRVEIISSRINRGDVVVFALAAGLVTRNWDDIRAAQAAGQPNYFMYLLPKKWAQPSEWRGLSGLSMKSDANETLEVEIGGQDKGRHFLTEQIKLLPRARLEAREKFYSVHYMHVGDDVDGRVGIHHPRLNETILVQPRQWVNLWVYGMEIILLGYIQGAELLSSGERVPVGSHTLQAPHGTRNEYVGIPIRELHSMEDLFTRARKWAAQQ